MSPNPDHRAQYDENGDIVIPGEREKREDREDPTSLLLELPTSRSALRGTSRGAGREDRESTELSRQSRHERRDEQVSVHATPIVERDAVHPLWEEIEETTPLLHFTPRQPVVVWQELRGKLQSVTSGIISEGNRQIHWSLRDGRSLMRRLRTSARTTAASTWSFLTQPVWVPGRRNTPKQYSRWTLFVLDVVRFGGTFAFLFTGLFLALNYQSFWQIVESRIDPLQGSRLSQDLEQEAEGTLAEKLKRVPQLSLAGRSDGDLLSFLPPVGPPIPTLIIPKLNLNVPIVIPSADPLLREDWKGLEDEIQRSLRDGVVHYPGTARPGQAGNFFITGHSSYFPWDDGRYKSVFARLGDLEVGDEYWVFYGGDKYRYHVTTREEVKPSDVNVLDQPMSKRLATLMTCTPVGTTLRRLIIKAEEVDPVTGTPLKVGEHGRSDDTPKVQVETLPI